MNTAWNVYLFTSSMAIFLSKEPQFVLQILSGCSFVSFRYIFSVPLTWESLKPPALLKNNAENRAMRITYKHGAGGSNTI